MTVLDRNANLIIETLIENGFEAFYVGGCVRTIAHNAEHFDDLPIKDFDIVTNASYEDMTKIFKHVEDRGESFNVAIVKMNGQEYEVARYRGETYPEGGSIRPNEVFNVDTLEEDLLRRDFKMNGLVIDKEGFIVDHVGGLDDIKNKLISTIGDPNKRFSEDPLRILRAIRFVSQLGYNVEGDTLIAMINNVHLLHSVPHSRIEGEFSKIIKSKYPLIALTMLHTIYKRGKTIPFKNTITGNIVLLLPSLLSLSIDDFHKVIQKLNNTSGTVGFFYSLYCNFDAELVEKELTDMQITNKETISKVVLLVENKDLVANQTRENLLKFARSIKSHNSRESLNRFLEIYSKVNKVGFWTLEDVIKNPLFIKELPYNGQDIMSEGLKLGYNIQGKLVGEILELGREKSVLGEEYSLAHILDLFKNKLEAI